MGERAALARPAQSRAAVRAACKCHKAPSQHNSPPCKGVHPAAHLVQVGELDVMTLGEVDVGELQAGQGLAHAGGHALGAAGGWQRWEGRL